MFLKLGVHADRISLARAEPIIGLIRQSHPDVQVERKIFQNGKESNRQSMIFLTLRRKPQTAEPLLVAVTEKKVDFGVFNMRDLPMLDDDSRVLVAATPERSSPYDVLVTRNGKNLKDLKASSNVGASTLLRIAQLRKMRPDLKVEPVSGSVEERIAKLDKGEFDAIITAESGLARLGMSSRISERLSFYDFMPLPGQGVTALVCRRDNQRTIRLLMSVDDSRTRREADAERDLLRFVRLRCRIPLGAYASTSGDRLTLSGCMVSSDGQDTIRASDTGPTTDPSALAKRVGESFFNQGVLRLEEGWRKQYPLYDD